MTDYAHHVIGLAQVRAEIEPDNYASIAVAEGLGFRPSGEEPEAVNDGRRSFKLQTWMHQRSSGPED